MKVSAERLARVILENFLKPWVLFALYILIEKRTKLAFKVILRAETLSNNVTIKKRYCPNLLLSSRRINRHKRSAIPNAIHFGPNDVRSELEEVSANHCQSSIRAFEKSQIFVHLIAFELDLVPLKQFSTSLLHELAPHHIVP
jgi:hypothetical protein